MESGRSYFLQELPYKGETWYILSTDIVSERADFVDEITERTEVKARVALVPHYIIASNLINQVSIPMSHVFEALNGRPEKFSEYMDEINRERTNTWL